MQVFDKQYSYMHVISNLSVEKQWTATGTTIHTGSSVRGPEFTKTNDAIRS